MQNTKKIVKGKRASEIQKEFLINFLEKNLDIANDKFVTPEAVKYRDEVWDELTKSLNALDGTKKDSTRWRKFWSDLKLYICNKHNAIHTTKQNDNRFVKTKRLSCLEKRVLQIALTKTKKMLQVPAVENISNFVSLDEDEITFEDIKPTIEEFMVVSNDSFANENSITSEYVNPENISTNAATIQALKQKRKFKRKTPAEAVYLSKLLKMEEKKLKEMKEANSLKRQQIAILEEQTESMKANVQAKEIIAINLQHLVNVIGKKS